MKVALIDAGDFAGQTSMQSSNLAWGGIKYMESLEFRLVRKLCQARNTLMRAYPTAVRETRFLTTVPRGFRWPRLVLYLGAWLYWFIGSFFTKTPRLLSRRQLQSEQPLLNLANSVGGFEYSDAHLVDGDARFVFGFVKRAGGAGATVLNYASAQRSRRENDEWVTDVEDRLPGGQGNVAVRSRVVINATGPFADGYNETCGVVTRHQHVLSKGVHLNVRRIAEGNRVLAFFATDGRLFFAIPLGQRSCIGTTDTRTNDVRPTVSDEDRTFILDNINQCLRLERPLTTKDVLAERCGVRPLVVTRRVDDMQHTSDWTSLSRKHVIESNAPLSHITIFGGKLTDCLNVGKEITAAVEALGVQSTASNTWFGEPHGDVRAAFFREATSLHLAPEQIERLWRCYGAEAPVIVELLQHNSALGAAIHPECDVLQAEAVYAAQYEMIETADDFLRRRTHLAQELNPEEIDARKERVNELLFGAAP
jgi:glycerol-3-phosphate dehydrogenase